MNLLPDVSVIIPVYNTEKYLHQTLSSVCNQTLENIEIICVDDGSKDNSLKILKKYASKDNRIKVLHQENQGAAVARNLGLQHARGRYLSILDSDDYFNKTMLETAFVSACLRDADIVVFRADQKHDKTNKIVKTPWTAKSSQLPAKNIFTINDVKSNVFQAIQGWTWDKLFKKSFVDELGISFQEQQIYNDMLFTFSAYISAKRITFVDITLIHQRKRGGGSLSDNGSSRWTCLKSALLGLREYLYKTETYNTFEQDFINYVIRMVLYQISISTSEDAALLLEDVFGTWSDEFGLFDHEKSFYEPYSNVAQLKEFAFELLGASKLSL